MKRALLMLMLIVALALAGLIPLAADAAPYGASYAPSPDPLPALTTGQTMSVSVTVKNAGTLTWTPTGANPFRLSYHWYPAGAVPAGTVPSTPAPNYGAVVFNGLRTNLPGPIGSTASVPLSAQVQAPSMPGTYVLKWDLVHEGVTWFSRQGVPTKDQTVTVRSRAVAGEPFKALRATCKIIDCTPKITSVFPLSFIRPAGAVLVFGERFGGPRFPGQLRLKGLRRWDGAPVGDLPLEDLSWDDTAVGGTIPWVTGVRDQDATLQVVTKAGHASNEQKVRFTAARTADRLLPRHARVVTCSQASGQINKCFAGPGTSDLARTLTGEHIGGSDAYGSDIFYAALQNDWVFDDYAWGYQHGIQGGPLGFHPGSFQTQLAVNWFHDVLGRADYGLDLYITGPDGVPY